jgi:hypothetical protein
MGVFFIRSVSDTIFAMMFLPKRPADHLAYRRGPPVVRVHSLENTDLKGKNSPRSHPAFPLISIHYHAVCYPVLLFD